jgi:predicted nucleotidyltransferase
VATDLADLEQRLSRALAPIEDVRVAYVFGSRVSGRTHPASDLDVAVQFAPGVDRRTARLRALGALADALGALGERVDLVDVEQADSAVAFRAIREGRCVLARDRRDRVSLEARIARRYDDDAPKRALFRGAAVEAAGRLGEQGRG